MFGRAACQAQRARRACTPTPLGRLLGSITTDAGAWGMLIDAPWLALLVLTLPFGDV